MLVSREQTLVASDNLFNLKWRILLYVYKKKFHNNSEYKNDKTTLFVIIIIIIIHPTYRPPFNSSFSHSYSSV